MWTGNTVHKLVSEEGISQRVQILNIKWSEKIIAIHIYKNLKKTQTMLNSRKGLETNSLIQLLDSRQVNNTEYHRH